MFFTSKSLNYRATDVVQTLAVRLFHSSHIYLTWKVEITRKAGSY